MAHTFRFAQEVGGVYSLQDLEEDERGTLRWVFQPYSIFYEGPRRWWFDGEKFDAAGKAVAAFIKSQNIIGNTSYEIYRADGVRVAFGGGYVRPE